MPRRKGGLYLPLDVNFFDDPRIVRAGEKATTLYLAMALACKRLGTDGRLEPLQIDRLHVPGWKARLATLLREQLVLDLDDGSYTIAAWLQHNDPASIVAQRRAEDAARKRGQAPHGIRTESVPSRSVERSREEKREVRTRSESGPEADCEHGVDRHAGCRQCSALRVVSSS
jgi:hypothetical protein